MTEVHTNGGNPAERLSGATEWVDASATAHYSPPRTSPTDFPPVFHRHHCDSEPTPLSKVVPQQQGNFRPLLQRVDSRASFQQRPGLPPNVQFRPPLQQRPPYPPGSPRPGTPPQRPVVYNQQSVRPPAPSPIPTTPIARPTTPYPRPPQPRPTTLQPQRSFLNLQPRSQILDSTDEKPENAAQLEEKPIMMNEESKQSSVLKEESRSSMLKDDRPESRNSILKEERPESRSSMLKEERPESRSSMLKEERPESRSSMLKEERPESRSSMLKEERPESRNSVKKGEDKKVAPPNSIPLNGAEGKQSNSPSPQPESVIEIKPRTQGPVQKTEITKSPKAGLPKSGRIPSPRKSRTPIKKEGDNDSGVDESTQGNDHSSNGDHSSRKSARNNSRLTTPTKNRSFSRGSRSPNLMSPDSMPTTPGGTEKKKLPMNKIQVGAAPSPNLKVVRSKIGSLANTSYKPGGGNIKIEHKKIDVSNAQSKIGAKNEAYAPSGGEKKIISQKLQWSAKSKIGSLENATHKPKGGDKKIESVKLDFKDKAKSKIGSKDNIKHQPGGGDIKIETKKLNIKGESKVGSLDNVKHRPGGGDKKIFDDKEYLRQKSGLSNDNLSVSGSQNSLPSQPSDAREPVSDENLNREH